MAENDNGRAAKPAPEARASGQNVRTVLVVSLIGAILLLILIAAVTFR